MVFVASTMREKKEQLAIGVAHYVASPRGMGFSAKMRRLVYADKPRPRYLADLQIVSRAVTVCGVLAN